MLRAHVRATRNILAAAIAIACCVPAEARADLALLFGAEVPFAQDTGTQPIECQATSIRSLGRGARPDWSPDGRFIYFDKLVGGTFELHRMNADGSGRRCLTCPGSGPAALAGKHKGIVTVNRDGQHVVFSAENENGAHRMTNSAGFGEDNDLWAMDVADTFWRLTSLRAGSAIQSPRFSGDGKKLIWSERYARGNITTTGNEFGRWTLKVADFVVTPAGPKLTNVLEIEPLGPGYYEPHGSSPSGDTLVFTAMVDPDRSQFYGEIYALDLATLTTTWLAGADELHFEHAGYAPGGNRLVFVAGPFIGLSGFGYKTDLYLMDADGGNRVRLTHFNGPGHSEYTRADTLMTRPMWSPDGNALAGGYYIHKKRREMSIFTVTFQGACGAF